MNANKPIVVSYSLSGNNEALAARLAGGLGAEHVKISELKPRGIKEIAFDMLFGRVPAASPEPGTLRGNGPLLFVGPVWMGKSASPLRSYLRSLKKNPRPYAFVSISGGADGPESNSGLMRDLKARTGREPQALIDLHIADLLPKEPKPTREDTSAYKLSAADLEKLSARILASLEGSLGA